MLRIKCFLLILIPFFLHGQVSFEPFSKAFGNIEIHSQIPIAVSDINNDFLDDIITLDKGNHLKVFYQSQNAEEYYYKDYGLVSSFDQLAIGVGDMDNDGIKEIFIGGYYDGIKIYKAFSGSDDYLQFKKTDATFYTQNLSLVDIDNDGFLDIYVNDDDGPPQIFRNKNGSDFENVEWIDFGNVGEDASGNYGGLWTDFDNDGDLDLYISKCRLGVSDPADIRRINQLYINDGAGGFEERASEVGLHIGEQSWVSEFVDLDNDGDKDVVIVNHTGRNMIFENIGNGQYQELDLGENWNEVFEGLQLVIRDFDNDGLKDVLIGGFKSKLFWNKGGLLFEEEPGFIGNKEALSLAVGDLNNDGFWDIYNSFANGLTEDNRYVADEILINKTNENGYLKINLRYEAGNYDAIGSTCALYGEWGVQSYELRSGESYGINNSLSVIFGLGEYTSFDSLIIKWPNGERMNVIDLDINTQYTISDSACINSQLGIVQTFSTANCTNNVVLAAPEFKEYNWGEGQTNQSISIENTGLYKVTVTAENGCEYVSPSILNRDISDIPAPEIYIVNPEKVNCDDDIIELRTQYESVLWNNEVESSSYFTSAKNFVFASYIYCDELSSDIFTPQILRVDTPLYILDTIAKGEDAIFKAEGQNIKWYETQQSGVPIGEGSELLITNLQSDSIIYVENSLSEKGIDSIFINIQPIEFGLPPANINGGLIFSVERYNTILESVRCYTDTSAIRKIQIVDYWGTVIKEKEVLISPADSIIELNFDLKPSNYYLLTTDGDFNKETLGSKSPRLMRGLYDQSLYDLSSEDGNVIIQGSTGSPDLYYSFYDWKIKTHEVHCVSKRVGVPIFVEASSLTEDKAFENITVSPNPFIDEIYIQGFIDQNINFSLFNLDGKLMQDGKLKRSLDFSNLESGMYFLKIGLEVYKLIKL